MWKKIWNKIYWWYWSGKYTKIKLFHVSEIGVDSGYFECQHAHYALMHQFYRDDEKLGLEEACRLLDERSAANIKKYFGPKYVKRFI